MKELKDILYKVSITEVHGSTNIAVGQICFDSRKVLPGDVFVATRGVNADGHVFIEKALELGAVAVVCEILPEELRPNVSYVCVLDASIALGIMASNFYGDPSSKLTLVGVTGTNGKTSTATILFRVFRELGNHVGLLSTVQNQIDEDIIPSTHTTPDAVQLNALLAKMVESGCSYCFMEVSSHAVDQNRIAGLKFKGALFTNITHDHLDYHKTFRNYLQAKKKFFDQLPADAFAITNADDRNGSVMLQNTRAQSYSYALKVPADFKGKILENSFTGLVMIVDGEEMHSRLVGEFNAYNLLCVYGACLCLGVEKQEALRILSNMVSAEGRFDYVISPLDRIIGIVDYAHTPDALQKVLETIRNIRSGNEQLIAIVGCGGDRDAAKRPVMAQTACDLSDRVILTSDNPRSEDPDTIIREMESGLNPIQKKKAIAITDRKEAIRTACMLAKKGDIILVAGKGHEKYQEIKGVKYPFDDKEILFSTFKELDK